MPLSIDEVRHIARLARLRLSPEEEQRYTEQLSAILDYAARLSSIDTSAVSPTATVLPFPAPLRPDEIRLSLDQALALANAPASEDGLFRVPPVLES